MLAVRRFGSGPPIVALHGFTFTGEQFANAASRLARTVIAPDLPGHGRSRYAQTRFDRAITAIATTIDDVGVPVPLIGYSQGGRLAAVTAVRHPDPISALILVSATAGIEGDSMRHVRADEDLRTAADLRTRPLDGFLDSWTSTGITSVRHLDVEELRADRKVRLENTPEGLADAIVGMGQGSQPSVWPELALLAMPVLIVSGASDRKYRDIGERMTDLIPDAEHVSIDGSGHNPFLEAPNVVYPVISDFLERRG